MSEEKVKTHYSWDERKLLRKAAASRINEALYGMRTGYVDRNGRHVRFGDRMAFDPKEWGTEYEFEVQWDHKGIHHAGDFDSWCWVVRGAK